MTRFYQAEYDRLIYVEQEATPDYWSQHWDALGKTFERIRQTQKTIVTDVTPRYLKPEDGLILEGGCGNGQQVAALVNHGYRCTGIDYAEQTVAQINQHMADLDVRTGDVTALDFAQGAAVGYWSLGVIEHFWDGFEPAAAEMARVVAPGGYLFLTFPCMSPLRRLKSRLGAYPLWLSGSEQPPNFYQFALNVQSVIDTLRPMGFTLVETLPGAGLKGLKDELPSPFNGPLQRLYNYRGKNLAIRGVRYGLEQLCLRIAGHIMLVVLRREEP